MNVFYEEDGGFKVGAILADNTASLQVEAAHGKRSKIKASAVLLKFEQPALGEFMERAQQAADELEADFLWECCGQDEFGFAELGQEYFGRAPTTVEAAGLLIRLHGSPMHFYKKGKGRYKAAPAEALKAALASVERKRQQALLQAEYVEKLKAFEMPEGLLPHVNTLLYKADKNTLEYKALELACHATALTPPQLLEKCGALTSAHDYHLNGFLFEYFPKGHGFGEIGEVAVPQDLPLSKVVAFSIDDASTTEIDDAFSLITLPNGNWQVGIHIAAPALGFEPGSKLDEIGLERLSTVYMPGNKITMLPDELVSVYTLDAEKECPALSMYLEVESADYSVVSMETRVERIKIAENLRHDTLEPVFNEDTIARGGPDFPFKNELHILFEFAKRLEISRGKEGSNQGIDYNFVIENDRVTITDRKRGNPIDKVVSELMIFVNSRWGKMLAENGVAAIYRSQNNGKVRMSTTPGKHVGLGVDQYTWASSPLRRYVDMINQRQLISLVRGEPAPYTANSDVLHAAVHDFEIASEAYNGFQRSMERYWCLRYIQQEGISEVTATVLKENLVRFDTLPLVIRVPSLPEVPPGTQVSLGLSDIELLEMSVVCQFKQRLEAQ